MVRKRLKYLASLFHFQIFCSAAAVDPLVVTKQGVVRGQWSSDGTYAQYMGIPYAIVNADNPFGDALPGPTFNDVFDADNDWGICPQLEEFNNTLIGSLDCLHVNIYVPRKASTNNSMPVMAFIFGGYFAIGFAGKFVLGPQYIVRNDVILVTFNYRLGPYGFMCLDLPEVPGNTGLKDQRLALRWVKENISAFGGDGNMVTLVGNSAGATSVDLHVLSPGSNGLFNAAISMSGTIFTDRGINTPSDPVKIAKYLGRTTDDTREALNFLKSLSELDVIKATTDMNLQWAVCIEKPFPGVEPFMIELPSDILKSGRYEKRIYMIGCTIDEYHCEEVSNIRKYSNYIANFKENYTARLLDSLDISPGRVDRIASLVEVFYKGTDKLTKDNFKEYLIDYASDILYAYPSERSIQHYYNNINPPIYQYVLAYNGDINFKKGISPYPTSNNITEGGASHADDLGFLFRPSWQNWSNSEADQLAIDRYTKLWTNFVKYRDPTPEVTSLLPVRWPLVDENRYYINVDAEITIRRKFNHERFAFWDLIWNAFDYRDYRKSRK